VTTVVGVIRFANHFFYYEKRKLIACNILQHKKENLERVIENGAERETSKWLNWRSNQFHPWKRESTTTYNVITLHVPKSIT
jgi:hypothetical protein